MKSLFKFSIVSILLTATINFPSKAEFAKNSKSKVTVIELDDNDNFQNLNTFRIKTPQINKKTPLRFNTSSYSTSRKEPGNIAEPNSLSPTNFGTYGFPHTTSLVKSTTKPLNTNKCTKRLLDSSNRY